MELVLANQVSKPKRRKLKGREYLTVSASLIVPGVLNGSQGALFYPPDEVAINYLAWNGIPITAGHPADEQGNHISGRDPEVFDRVGLGHVYKTTANGKLAAEAWFDIEAVTQFDRRNDTSILQDLEAGKVVELSTGLFTENTPAPRGSNYNGKPYTHVARNYRPDHLALLIGQRGACSIDDGCGFNVNEADVDEPTENVGKYRNPQSKNTGKFKPHGSGTGTGDTHELAQLGAVVLTDEDMVLGKDASSQAEAGHNPPSWAVDEATWEKAKAAADKGDYEGDSYYAVVTHIYEKMGGTVQGKTENAFCATGEGGGVDSSCSSAKGSGGGKSEDVHPAVARSLKNMAGLHLTRADQAEQRARDDWFNMSDAQKSFPSKGKTKGYVEFGKAVRAEFDRQKQTTANELSEEQQMDRTQTIQFLTTNCGCWKGKTATLNKLSDDELKELLKNTQNELKTRKSQEAVLNAATKGIKVGAATLVVNSDGTAVLRNDEGEECAPDDLKCLEMMKAKAPPVPPPPPAKEETMNVEQIQKQVEAGLVKRFGFQSLEQMGATLNVAKEIEQNERRKLVQQLVGNIRDDGVRKQKAQQLLKRTTADLREQVELVQAALAANAQQVPAQQADDWSPRYTREDNNYTLYAPGGPLPGYGMSLTDNEAEDVLPDPQDTYAANGLDDLSVNAGQGVKRYFAGHRPARQQHHSDELEDAIA